MKGRLIAGIVTMTILGAVGYRLITWHLMENQQQEEQCKVAQQHLKTLQVQARAMASGLTVEGFTEAEEADVNKLVSALDTAKDEKEVDAVISEHSAAVEAQIAATDAEVKSQGDQPFLGQQRKEQRITTDVKQEIQRAEKAVSAACS
ncbi:hypothetical protein [Pseudomonas sp. PD9R]|uniref:hypothetical protein n=1 Tax=Pseudomonas sp. PD9R TaxID=2853534 RepID=UPI00210F00E9|nr:hypothetical protein [Pseudomonas sp. PD9R]